MPFGVALDIMIGDSDGIDARGHQPVDAAEYGVLFVEHARTFRRAGSEQTGQRGIAAEADDDGGVELADQVDPHTAALADRERGLEPADRAARYAACRQDMRFHLGRRARNPEPAVVTDQRDAMPARYQFAREA